MRITAIFLTLGLSVISSGAEAAWGWGEGKHSYSANHRSVKSAPHWTDRSYSNAGLHGGSLGRSLPAPCYAALNHGSYGTLTPCGCFAQGKVFGTYDRLMTIAGKKVNLWLAWTWAQVFPRTTPHAGAVAVTPGHVVVIDSVPSPGVLRVADSWGTHDVSAAGKVIVEPHR